MALSGPQFLHADPEETLPREKKNLYDAGLLLITAGFQPSPTR